MIRLPVKKLKKGMIIAQSIFNNHGGSFLVRGSAITGKYIRQLKKLGIPTVTVTSSDPRFHLMPPDDVVQEQTRIDAIRHVYDAFESVRRSGRLDSDVMQDVADHILIDLIDRPENLVQLTDIRLHDTYTFAHSVNVAILSAMLGLHCHYTKKDLQILTLGALLHDLGKSVDHEMEGSHVQLGVELARKYKENPVVINAIEAHHGDVEPQTVIACLVQAADAISAARPGARRENVENYIRRLEKLEELTNSFPGVEKAYAIQAGREVRVMVKPEEVTEDNMILLAHDLAKKIESELEYPGQIKVNVIRETKAVEYAK